MSTEEKVQDDLGRKQLLASQERAEERTVLLVSYSGILKPEYVKSPSLSYVVMVNL